MFLPHLGDCWVSVEVLPRPDVGLFVHLRAPGNMSALIVWTEERGWHDVDQIHGNSTLEGIMRLYFASFNEILSGRNLTHILSHLSEPALLREVLAVMES